MESEFWAQLPRLIQVNKSQKIRPIRIDEVFENNYGKAVKMTDKKDVIKLVGSRQVREAH